MAYIEWWNRTGPSTLGERFGLNEISTARKTLSPIKSHTAEPIIPSQFDEISIEEMEDIKKQVKFGQQVKDGGRIGLAEGMPKKVLNVIGKAVAPLVMPGATVASSAINKKLPDPTNPMTWVDAAFWNWAVKEWGFDKTVKNFGESLKTLSKGDKARVFRNVVARAGLSPKTLKIISSRIALPVAGAMSVYDAYKDYQKRKPDVEKQKELIEQGVVKEEEFDKEEPMFARGGKASLMK